MNIPLDHPQLHSKLLIAHRLANDLAAMGFDDWELGPIAERKLVIKLREELDDTHEKMHQLVDANKQLTAAIQEMNQRLIERTAAFMATTQRQAETIRQQSRAMDSHSLETFAYMKLAEQRQLTPKQP